MSEAWFGLLGVVVGGVITSLWAVVTSVRDDLGAAVVAARLVDNDLRRCGDDEKTFAAVQLTEATWTDSRSALARNLTKDAWTNVSACYRAAESELTWEMVAAAENGLAPFVKNKRRAWLSRWRNVGN